MTSKVLVLDLNGTIIHEADKFGDGKIRVRPHFETFIHSCIGKGYKIAVWSASNVRWVHQVVNGLFTDPKQLLFVWSGRECNYRNRKRTKPLIHVCQAFGLKMQQILILDNKPQNYQLNPTQGIAIKTYEGDPEDKELLRILTLL